MFVTLKSRPNSRGGAVLVSIGLHLLGLALLLHRPPAIFVRPSSGVEGKGGTSRDIVYFPRLTADAMPANLAQLTLPKAAHRSKNKAKVSKTERRSSEVAQNLAQAERAGSPFASSLDGLDEGHDVRPALPTIFPDPIVPRDQIPAGVEGRVIVEITIDTQGKVVDTRLLQGLGYGIEEKVIAAVQGWHFKPATRDGVAIASQQDVSFHFPS